MTATGQEASHQGLPLMRTVVLALLFSAAIQASAVAQQPELPYGFHVGEPFPTLAFPALEGGEPASVSDFRGRRLILHVFASW